MRDKKLGQILSTDVIQRELDGKICIANFGDLKYHRMNIHAMRDTSYGHQVIHKIQRETGKPAYSSEENNDVFWLHPQLFVLFVSRHYVSNSIIEQWMDEWMDEALSHPSLSVSEHIKGMNPMDENEPDMICVRYHLRKINEIEIEIGDTYFGSSVAQIAREEESGEIVFHLTNGTIVVHEFPLDHSYMIVLVYKVKEEEDDVSENDSCV
jgi:hypothetical protein